jgi:hypothetical protein
VVVGLFEPMKTPATVVTAELACKILAVAVTYWVTTVVLAAALTVPTHEAPEAQQPTMLLLIMAQVYEAGQHLG